MIDDSVDSTNVCPLCGHNLESEAACEHFVACLCDESDGFDCDIPVYFGYSRYESTYAPLLDACVAVFDAVVEMVGTRVASSTLGKIDLTDIETSLAKVAGHLLNDVGVLVDNTSTWRDDYDDVRSLLRDCAGGPMKRMLCDCHRAAPPEPWAVENWEISSGPGYTFTGTTLWAQDGGACVRALAAQLIDVAGAIKKRASL
ncbi:MAG: hypothetical protein HN341_02500 [Verrucomicrobia bacterium]|nr:hypothetical protein [Verrucomicrobiota bacterium]